MTAQANKCNLIGIRQSASSSINHLSETHVFWNMPDTEYGRSLMNQDSKKLFTTYLLNGYLEFLFVKEGQ